MAVITTTKCDRCKKPEPIDEEYTLRVHICEMLPRGGGFCTGHEMNRLYTFCAECKRALFSKLLAVINEPAQQQAKDL